MKKTMMLTAAGTALLFSLSAASAQGLGSDNSKGATPKAQSPAVSGQVQGQADTKGPGTRLQGQGDMRVSPGTTGQGARDGRQDAQKGSQKNDAMDSQRGTSGQAQRQDNMKAGQDKMGQDARPGSSPTMGQDSKSGAGPDQAGQQRNQTTGQGVAPSGRAGAAVQINETQRTKIKQSINLQTAPKATNVNFSVSVGTRVPQTVRLAPVPAAIVEVVPAYRGYLYFVVEERIVIVEPDTHEIVLIIT